MKYSEQTGQSESKIQYYCPMKCEGNKVYDQPGNCPVCNMHLVPVGAQNQNTDKNHEHNHFGHQHGHKHRKN